VESRQDLEIAKSYLQEEEEESD